MNFLQQLVNPTLHIPSLDDEIFPKRERSSAGREVEPLALTPTFSMGVEQKWGVADMTTLGGTGITSFTYPVLKPVNGPPRRRFSNPDETDSKESRE